MNDMIINKNEKTNCLNTNQLANGQSNQIENYLDNNSCESDDLVLTIEEIKELNQKHYSSLFTVDFPKNEGFLQKLIWIIYSPFIILFELIPSYRNNISQKYLFINFFMSLVLIFGIVAMMYILINAESKRLQINVKLWGNSLLGIIFSAPYMKYNMKVA